jgi:TonB family protein
MRSILVTLIVAVAFAAEATTERYVFEQNPSGDLKAYFAKMVRPKYPQTALALHKKGKGFFRLTIDRPTGAVTEVKVLKSTGVKVLDDSAAAALMQWRAKRNMLDHAVIPVDFVGVPGETGTHIKW